MIHDDAVIAPGTLAAIIVGLVLLAVGAPLIIVGLRRVRKDDLSLWAFGVAFGGVAALAGLCTLAIGPFPYTWEYNSYRTVDGTVAIVQSRFLAGDKGTSVQEFYTVQYTTGQVFRCDDGRCGQAKPGTYLVLSCIREFQWIGTPGWNCAYSDNRTQS